MTWETLTFQEYFDRDAASVSGLVGMKRSPYYAKNREFSETPAMTLGTAFHCMVLEPLEFPRRFVTAGVCSASKKNGDRCTHPGVKLVGGSWLCGVHSRGLSGDTNLVVLAESDVEILEAQRDLLMAQKHVETGEYLWPRAFDHVEVSQFGYVDDLFMRMRPDAVLGGTIYDIKRMAQPGRVHFVAQDFGWLIRAGVYLALSGLDEYVYVCVGQYEVEFYRVTAEQAAAGLAEARELAARWMECDRAGEWPAGSGEIRDLPVQVAVPELDWSDVEVDSE